MAYISEEGQGRGFLALRQIGVYEKTCCAIVDAKGDPWAYKLAKYVTWHRLVKPENRARTAASLLKSLTAWPDWFADRFAREEKIAHQAAQLNADARAAKRRAGNTATAPTKPVVGGVESPSLAALSPADRAALIADALATLDPKMPQAKWLHEHAKAPEKLLEGPRKAVIDALLLVALAAKKKGGD